MEQKPVRGDEYAPHPFWDRKLYRELTPRGLVGIVVVVLIFIYAGFAQQP